jgi:hypothetical protein
MANLTFPSNPTNGQKFTSNGKVFAYDSTTQRWSVTRVQLLGSLPDDVTIETPDLTLDNTAISFSASGTTVYVHYTVSDDVSVSIANNGLANTDYAVATLSRSNNTITITSGATEFSTANVVVTATNNRTSNTASISLSAAYQSALWQYIDISVKARTNASPTIYDASGNNHTITISSGTGGIPTANTAQTKFASHSVYFPGGGSRTSGPHLRLPNQFSSFGATNWTHEFWMYVTALPSIQQGIAGNNNATNYMSEFRLKLRTDGKLDFNAAHSSGSYDLADITSSVAISTNTWTHVAVVRNGANITLYIDGTNRANAGVGSASAVLGRNGAAAPFMIGKDADDMVAFFEQTTDYFNGYIENYQIFQGYAKYTSNFTAPTAEQTQSYQAP